MNTSFISSILIVLAFGISANAQVQIQPPKVERAKTDGQASGDLQVQINFHGEDVENAKFIRDVVTVATDDTGSDLLYPEMHHGWQHSFGQAVDLSIGFSLKGPAAHATSIKTLTGEEDFFVPANDPNSTVTVDQFQKLDGKAIDSPVLAAAGVEVTFSGTGSAPVSAQSSFAYTTGPGILSLSVSGSASVTVTDNTPAPAAGKKRRRKKGPKNQDASQGAITLTIKDPNQKLIGMEFQDISGNKIEGSSFSGVTMGGTETRSYQFPSKLPDTTRLVIYLSTPKSVVTVPFSFTNVALH